MKYCFWLTILIPLLSLFAPLPVQAQTQGDWPMVAGNPQRSSWATQGSGGNLQVEWYRPIEAFIPMNSQLIAADGKIFVATARGLYALDAVTGNTVWQFNTELPLGNSPTYHNGVIYVAGFDKKIHAFNSANGTPLWEFTTAKAGYDTNPLVLKDTATGNQTLVITGSRDGRMYAVYGNDHPQKGQLAWAYPALNQPPLEPIRFSPAYTNGTVYFAASDNRGYALNVANGQLKWRSAVMPGDQFQSFWPVIFKDKVIFASSLAYRHNSNPGSLSYNNNLATLDVQGKDVMFDNTCTTYPYLGTQTTITEPWAAGKPALDVSRITEYLENNPDNHPYLHKPYRRLFMVLNQADGQEYTFDSDHDGYPEFMPFLYLGTRSGNVYPPIVNPNEGVLYGNNGFHCGHGAVVGWDLGSKYVTFLGRGIYQNTDGTYDHAVFGRDAIDEPQSISGGGNFVYRSICCDRLADFFDLNTQATGKLWDYSNNLFVKAPGYNEMWYLLADTYTNLVGMYRQGSSNNGWYHSHGDQNPVIPYQGRAYIHRGNAILAFGPRSGSLAYPVKKDLLRITPVRDQTVAPPKTELVSRLENEINKFDVNGDGVLDHLKPGYYNHGQFQYPQWAKDYFSNPGDTLSTLSQAYPHLSTALQAKVKTFLKQEFATYFNNTAGITYTHIGWSDGYRREAFPLPPEVEAAMVNPALRYTPKNTSWENTRHYLSPWGYPQHNLYALWKFAAIMNLQDTQERDLANRAYDLAKSRVVVPMPALPSSSDPDPDKHLKLWTFDHNAYLTGYVGFLNLQKLVGKDTVDTALKSQVEVELAKQLNSRAALLPASKDSLLTDAEYHYRSLNCARQFIYLSKEVGDLFHDRQDMLPVLKTQFDTQYQFHCPYWLSSRFNAAPDEGVMASLYDYPALFQAKAWIFEEPYEELYKYLDAPAFERGDLFYLQNLITTIEAPYAGPTPTTNLNPYDFDQDGNLDFIDLKLLLTHPFTVFDFNNLVSLF